jgi:hypothetical protein
MHGITPWKKYVYKKPFLLSGDDLIFVIYCIVFKNLPQECLRLENATKLLHHRDRIWYPGWCNDVDSVMRGRELRFPVVMGKSSSRKRSVVLDTQEATDRQLIIATPTRRFHFAEAQRTLLPPHTTMAFVTDRRPAGPGSECNSK